MARRTQPTGLLTEAEFELMDILWRLGRGSVHDVLAALPPGRDLAYTSVSTVLRILEQKGFVGAEREGRGHVYLPRVTRDRYESTSARHLVSRVFRGAPSNLISRLLDDGDLSGEELERVRALLSEKQGREG